MSIQAKLNEFHHCTHQHMLNTQTCIQAYTCMCSHAHTHAHACGPVHILTWRYFDDLKTLDDSLPLYWSTCNFKTCDIERNAMKATHTMFVWRTRTAMEAAKNFTHYYYYYYYYRLGKPQWKSENH